MQPLNPFRQSEGLCGPASLKILLDHYGREFSEAELAHLCNATADIGTDHAGMITAAEQLGEAPHVKQDAGIEDLRGYVDKEIPVIVGWYSDYKGVEGSHYSVVYHVDDEMISMMDPERDEGMVTMSISEFEKVWYDFDGPEEARVDRWMMVIPGLRKIPES
jgi:ABC-type bacteriocin/lantibiotic exporter with double-glycine peptidase domain